MYTSLPIFKDIFSTSKDPTLGEQSSALYRLLRTSIDSGGSFAILGKSSLRVFSEDIDGRKLASSEDTGNVQILSELTAGKLEARFSFCRRAQAIEAWNLGLS